MLFQADSQSAKAEVRCLRMTLQHALLDACQRQGFACGNLNRTRDQLVRQRGRVAAFMSIKQAIKTVFSLPFRPVVDSFLAHAKYLGNRPRLQLRIDRNDASCLETIVAKLVMSGHVFQG